ncbi:non-canonical purine NTP pyrophosphatase [Hazenella coriacea]|uniref:DITPase n=1 Tax=Hazenella coriacea TaxID=1179467 RepID=A0A4R3L7E8_9BACL|nr:non-canonical purine NTP pyrophosphatase [Hazenella coriacea]TCS95693.1 dITPase [Hazenella coriacea]
MNIYFATQNQGKIEEANQVLAPLGYEVVGVQVPMVEPDTGTVEEIARTKLQQAMKHGYERIMVDDAGIYFTAYPQFPGVLSKRIFHRLGYRGLEKLLKDESREAWFEGAVSVYWDGHIQTFMGRTYGHLIEPLTSIQDENHSFPYDPAFIPQGDTRVLQQMSLEEKLVYSYRRRALEKMAKWLKKEMIQN